MKVKRELSPKVSDKNARFSKAIRFIFFVSSILAIAYVYQFQWRLMDSKGQYQDDYAWEIIAHEALTQQYHGIPEMKVTYGKLTHRFCGFWNFESIWGNCATVKIGLDVRDYRPEYRPIVEREVSRLIDQLRKPCSLLQNLALAKRADLAEAVGCNGRRRLFKIHIWVNEVTVDSQQGPSGRPNRWSISTVQHLYTTDLIEGEF